MTQIITNSMPLGVPGDLSRQHAIVESWNQNVTTPVTLFGVPVKEGAVDGTISPIAAADTSAAVLGFLVRAFPSQPGVTANEAFGAGTPPVSGILSVMREGYMVVKVNGGTPQAQGAVYVRTVAGAGPLVVGGIEASADGGNSFALTGATFTGGADSDGNAEIRFRVGT